MASKVEIYCDVTLTSSKQYEIIALAAVMEMLPKNVSFKYEQTGPDMRTITFTTSDGRFAVLGFGVDDLGDHREFHSMMVSQVYETLVKLVEKSGKMCGKESQLFRAKPVRGKKQ